MIHHRGKRIFLSASLLALGLVQGLPVLAQSNPPKEPKLVIELKALTETFEGLRSKESDTVAAGGGKLEGAILSAYAIKAAAAEIKKDVEISEKILVAGYGDVIGSDVYAAYDLERDQICKLLGGCPSTSSNLELAASAFIGSILPALSSLLRSETEVSSLDGGLTDDRLLAHAVAREYKENAIVLMPPTLTSINSNDETIKELNALKKARDDVDKNKPSPKKKAAVDAADAFFDALYTADKDGNIKLLDVIKARKIAEAMQDRKVLRVKIENSSGTLLKRKNLWVALGAPAIAASGGLIATYALDEGNGTSIKQGMVLCQAGVKNLRKIHKLDDKHNSRCKML